MHEQLENLTTLWTHEQARDALLADYKGLKETVKRLAEEITIRAARFEEAKAAHSALKDTERECNRRLEGATKRLKKTQHLIDMGQSMDYESAKTQIAQNEAIIDEVETELLELYEVIEAAEAVLEAATAQAALSRTKHAEAEVELAKRTPEIRAALNEVTPLRDAAREPIDHLLLSRYDLLRERGRSTMSDVKKSGCTACHVKLNATQLMEFRRDLSVQICTNCGRFLRHDLDE